jgi:hypothetical protein
MKPVRNFEVPFLVSKHFQQDLERLLQKLPGKRLSP